MARATAYSSPGFQYTRLPHYLIMALYLRQNSSSHFNIRGRNVTYECINILVCNPTFMLTIEHSSWQCNIPLDKVSDHNSYFQVCNSTCRMTIHRAKGWSKILLSAKEQFIMRRNNSRCKMTQKVTKGAIQHAMWQFEHASWQCNIRHHNSTNNSTCLWELGTEMTGVARAREPLLAHGNRTDPGVQKKRYDQVKRLDDEDIMKH